MDKPTWQSVGPETPENTDVVVFVPGIGMGRMIMYRQGDEWHETHGDRRTLKAEYAPQLWCPMPDLPGEGRATMKSET